VIQQCCFKIGVNLVGALRPKLTNSQQVTHRYSLRATVCNLYHLQKGAMKWPQDRDDKIRYVEFYLVNDNSVVSCGYDND